MRHPDQELLAQLALSTAGPDSAPDSDQVLADHLRDCPQCAGDVTALTRTADLARSEDADAWPAPPSRVWEAIVAELGHQAAPGGTASTGGFSPIGDPGRPPGATALAAPSSAELSVGRHAAPMPGGPADPPESDPTESGPVPVPVTELGASRSARPPARGWALPVAAALVGMLAGGAVIWALRSPAAAASPPPVLATAALSPVPGGPGRAPESGRAELLDDPSGPMLKVQSADLPQVAGSYQVWLLGADGRMVSLGVLSGGAGMFPVPHGISTADYGTVDISDEPPDGNPAHSKVSVLRGPLS